MKSLSIALLTAVTALAINSVGATAAVVCNEEGDCWKTKEKYEYKPEFKVKIYDDNWKWDKKEENKYRWRESKEGRGYWRKGVWIGF
jgi:hypothetical protein